VAAGLAVTMTPRSLAPSLAGVRGIPVVGDPARRVVYAVLAAGAVHPLVPPLLDLLERSG
jgi:hypothetical protein